MKQIYLPTFFFLLFSFVGYGQQKNVQNWLESRQSSASTLVFQLTNNEARQLYHKSYPSDSLESFLHTQIDIFSTDSIYKENLSVGHYLFVFAKQGELIYELQSVDNIQTKLLNNQRDFTLLVHDSVGNPVEAKVKFGKKNIKLDQQIDAYRLQKSYREGWLEISYDGHTSFFYVERNRKRGWLKKLKNKVIYSIPIRWIWRPPYRFGKTIVNSIRWGEPQGFLKKIWGIFDEYYRDDYSYNRRKRINENYQGYLAFNQPQYRPQDTVKLKAFITKRNGKPISKPLDIGFYHNRKWRSLATIEPYRKGGYAYEFVLDDSLDLVLDSRIKIDLDYKDKTIMSNHFFYEDYQLDELKFSIRKKHETHYYGSPQIIFASAKDANGLEILDGELNIKVYPKNIDHYHKDQVFIPNLLWEKTLKMETVGETKITIPDSIFNDISCDYKIECVLTNSNNEYHYKEESASFKNEKQYLTLELEQDSLVAKYFEHGKSQAKTAELIGYDDDVNEVEVHQLNLPAKIPINGFLTDYDLETDSLYTDIYLEDESASLQCGSERTADSVFIWLENPRNLTFWYDIYRNNMPIQRGKSKQLDFRKKANQSDTYFISLHYVWAGELKSEDYSVNPLNQKTLQIAVSQPAVVTPSQKTEIEVHVSNHKGKPVGNVDLTAFALTQKFKESNLPSLPNWEKRRKGRKYINEFDKVSRFHHFQEQSKRLKYEYWRQKLGLDSLAFFNFLYPDLGMYQTALPTSDSITQFAPFVVQDGQNQVVQMIYVNKELIYFKGADHIQPFSFQVDSGYHNIRIRTIGEDIELDSIYFQEAHKLIFSVDLDNLPPKVSVRKMNAILTIEERNLLNRSLLLLKNVYDRSDQFFVNGSRVYPLDKTKYEWNRSPSKIIGPMRMYSPQFVNYKKFETQFTFEPSYEYEFQNGLIKMKWQNAILSENYKFQGWTNKQFPFSDSVLTEEVWFDFLEPKKVEEDTFTLGYINTHWESRLRKEKGDYLFDFKSDVKIKNIILSNMDLGITQFIENGKKRKIQDLPKGNYRFTFLLDSGFYFERKVQIQAEGLNFERFGLGELKVLISAETEFKNPTSYIEYEGNNKGRVKGEVVTSAKIPIIGAVIKVKNQPTKTITNVRGEFEIEANATDTLLIEVGNMINEVIREIPVNNSREIKIRLMKLDTLKLPNIKHILTHVRKTQDRVLDGISSSNLQLLTGKVAGVTINDLNPTRQSINTMSFPGGHLVSGVVTDNSGELLPGVNIIVKGTSTGTTTDFDGNYELRAPYNATLVFSYVGYVSQEILVQNQYTINTSLQIDLSQLEEVVVVGYGSVKVKSSATLNLTSAKTITKQPLIVIDGVIYEGSMDDLDPATIGSVEVLKYAAATAIYGSRAANGVVVIQSKNNDNLTLGKSALDDFTQGKQRGSSLRSNFSDYAFWQPKLRTNRQGKATFKVTFPDDITSWDTYIFAMNHRKQTGITSGKIKSFKPLVGNLALPRFLVVGDESQVVGKALNYTSEPVQVTSTFALNDSILKEKNVLITDSQIDTLTISTTTPDTLKLRYQLEKTNGYLDGEEREIPIYPIGVEETKGSFWTLESDTTFVFEPDTSISQVKLLAKADLLEVLLEEIEHIKNYPYTCNEQTASKLLMYLMEKEIFFTLGKDYYHNGEIRKLIRKLEKAQNDDGGWGWWSGNKTDVWMTSHVLKALAKAQNMEFTTISLQKTINYISWYANTVSSSQQLQIFQMLTDLKVPIAAKSHTKRINEDSTLTLPDFIRLQWLQKQHDLPYEVDTLQTLQKETLFGGIYWGEASSFYFYDNSIQTTLLAYQFLKGEKGFENYPEKIRQYFLMNRKDAYWRNTYESTTILSTILPDILENVKPEELNSSLTVKGSTEETITQFPYEMMWEKPEKIAIEKNGKLPLYLTIYQKEWNSKPEKVEKDFIVQSSFFQNDDTVAHLEAGQIATLNIKLKVKKKAEFVMIEVPIPAGCSYGKKPSYHRFPEVHREHFKEKVTIFCRTLKQGEYNFSIALQPRYTGKYMLNPAKAELMYFPTFFGREEVKLVRIEED